MGEQIRSFGEGGQSAPPASIENKAAKEKTASTSSMKSNDENSMKPPVVHVHNTNNLKVEPVDGKAVNDTVNKTVFMDQKGGQMGK